MTASTDDHRPGAVAGEPALLRRIRESVVGDGTVMDGPYGPRRVTYADYTASGRSLGFMEQFIRDQVLPHYANTHTESSGTGLQTTRLREDARGLVRAAVGGDDSHAVLFCGSGTTAAVDRLVALLGLRVPAALDDRYHLSDVIPADERPVVFLGPFEHHSNELPWRETIADVVTIPEDADGHVDLDALEAALRRHAGRPLLIGSFSAASNVTGIVTDTHAVTELLHAHGALAFWDFAAAAPYVEIEMSPPDRPQAHKDAIAFSPHKFIGGPGTPGVLVVRKALLTNRVPAVPGGGTVAYVNPTEHKYLEDPEHREEGGTPAIVESIRCGLVMQLKAAVGTEVIRAREERLLSRALTSWAQDPALQVLGNTAATRLSIVSFVVRRPGGRYLHHNLVVAILNDLFGIQSRGGCSCAGPYGHRLLGIGAEQSQAFEREITGGCEGIKPGWVRVNFNYFVSDTVADYVIDAVKLVAAEGWRLTTDYRFDPATGLWRHRAGRADPPLSLHDVHYDPVTGEMGYPRTVRTAGEDTLVQHLADARALLAARRDDPVPEPAADGALSGDFLQLQWFDLPAVCLT